MGNADLEFPHAEDGLVRELMQQNWPGAKGCGDAPVGPENFEHLAHDPNLHRNVLLVQITVEGSLPGNVGRHVLDSVRWQ